MPPSEVFIFSTLCYTRLLSQTSRKRIPDRLRECIYLSFLCRSQLIGKPMTIRHKTLNNSACSEHQFRQTL